MAHKTIKIWPVAENSSQDQIKNALGDVEIARIAVKKSAAYVQFQTEDSIEVLEFTKPENKIYELNNAKFEKVDPNFNWDSLSSDSSFIQELKDQKENVQKIEEINSAKKQQEEDKNKQVLHQEIIPKLNKLTSMETDFMKSQQSSGSKVEQEFQHITEQSSENVHTKNELPTEGQKFILGEEDRPQREDIFIMGGNEEEEQKRKEEEIKRNQESRIRQQEENRKRKQEQDRKRKQQEERVRKNQQEERKKKQQEQRIKKQQEERIRKEVQDKKRKQQEERKKKQEEEKRKHDLEQQRKREQQNRKQQQRKKKEQEDKKRQQQQTRRKIEDQLRHKKEVEQAARIQKQRQEKQRQAQEQRQKELQRVKEAVENQVRQKKSLEQQMRIEKERQQAQRLRKQAIQNAKQRSSQQFVLPDVSNIANAAKQNIGEFIGSANTDKLSQFMQKDRTTPVVFWSLVMLTIFVLLLL